MFANCVFNCISARVSVSLPFYHENLFMLWFIKWSRFPRDPSVCVAMGRDCCIMSAICADVMVLVCNGACKVSLTLYDTYAPIFVFDAVYVCRNLAFYLRGVNVLYQYGVCYGKIVMLH